MRLSAFGLLWVLDSSFNLPVCLCYIRDITLCMHVVMKHRTSRSQAAALSRQRRM